MCVHMLAAVARVYFNSNRPTIIVIKSDLNSLDFVIIRVLIKLFKSTIFLINSLASYCQANY